MGVRRNRMRVFAVWIGLMMLGVSPLGMGQTAPNSSDQVLAHVNQVLRWSRQWDSADIYLSRPGDELYVENGRNIAQQVVKLDFQSALAQAALIGEQSPRSAVSNDASAATEAQNISKMVKRLGQQMQDLQTRLDTVNRKIATARAKNRPALTTERDTLQGQLQLAQALDDDLGKLSAFMSTAEGVHGVASELSGKIVALQRAIPSAVITPASGKGAAKSSGQQHTAPAPIVSNAKNEGLIGQMGQMIHFVQSMRRLDQMKDEAAQLQNSTKQLRAPLLTALRSTLQQGQIELANAAQSGNANGQSGAANSTSPAAAPPTATAPAAAANQPVQTPEQKQREMAALIRHFKLLSSATLPLSQELILLGQSQSNLSQLQTSLKHDYISILRTLLLKVATLLIALGLIWLFSELWRRATFRYIHDARRRRQFLVMRRVVTGFCMFVVILLGFVSDFSSLATYAGLITAGVAVALQAVILSVAAYFFLVGRYGVKVGDRITVVYAGNNSVAGDVVDIGLVRFYMMELAGSGIDMQPTGRICVFPNSVLFQTNPLFKQMPGAEYAWREIALPLSTDSDGQLAEKELMAAVERLYSGYGAMLERQHTAIESTMGVHMDVPKPYTRVRFVGSGLEVMVRYPIPLRQAAELDDRMVQAVTEMLRKNPAIKLAAGAAPDLRSPVKA